MRTKISRQLLWLIGILFMVAFSSAAQAIFTNGGFENNSFYGWSKMNAYNPGLKLPLPFTLNSLQLTNVGTSTELLSVVGSIKDPRTDNLLQLPGAGSYTAKVNDEYGDNHVNSIFQTDSLSSTDLGSDGQYHIRFSYAAVLEDPQHNPEEQPFFYVLLQDLTSNTTLYSEFTYSNQPGRSFHTSANYYGWLWTDWQNVDIALPSSSLGHAIKITVLAADCSLGGHGGYVYLDGFGSQGSVVTGMTLSSLSPSSATVGGQAFTMTVTGTGFQSGDVVQWNGLSRATTYVSSTQLTAAMQAVDLASAGSQTVTVARGTQTSNSATFTVSSGGSAGTSCSTSPVLNATTYQICVPYLKDSEIFATGNYNVLLSYVANSNPMKWTVSSSALSTLSSTGTSDPTYANGVLTIPALSISNFFIPLTFKVVLTISSFTAPYTFTLTSAQ